MSVLVNKLAPDFTAVMSDVPSRQPLTTRKACCAFLLPKDFTSSDQANSSFDHRLAEFEKRDTQVLVFQLMTHNSRSMDTAIEKGA